VTRRLLQLLVSAAAATALLPLVAAPTAAAETAETAAAKTTIDCIDEDTDDKDATPYYDARFDEGPRLGSTVLEGYVPQGLTTWRNYYGPGLDLLVYTAYDEDGDHLRAVMQGVDPRDGSLTNIAYIGPGHAGGVAIHGEWAYVSAPDASVRRYDLDELRQRFAGRETAAMDGRPAGDVVGPASFLAVYGDTLFVGRHDEKRSSMRRYPILDSGRIGQPVGAKIRVPAKTQGLLVLPDHFVYSTSLGRDNRSNVYVVGRGYRKLDAALAAGQLQCFRAPTMSEGVTISQGRVYLLFESGASFYAENEDGKGVPDRVIEHLHWADRASLPFSP
jgi:hypothetical protein